jgi:hypothetical protein
MRESASEFLSHGGILTISVVRTVDSVIFETGKNYIFEHGEQTLGIIIMSE